MKNTAVIKLDPRNHRKALITNSMKAELIGEHKFYVEKECPRCLYIEDVPCECNGSDDGLYQVEHVVPWDLAKKIYQDFSAIAIKEAKE